MIDGFPAFDGQGNILPQFQNAKTACKADTLYQQVATHDDGPVLAAHTITSLHAHGTFCGDVIQVVTCSCGARFGVVATRNGGCGQNHHPIDLPPADEWHRAALLFDTSQPVQVDEEMVARDHLWS